MENVNHSTWKSATLKKIARALGVRVKITFETFGTLLDEDSSFCRGYLERPGFADDPAFGRVPAPENLATRSLESAMSRLLGKAEATDAKSEEERRRGGAASASPVGNGMPHGAMWTIALPTGERMESLTAVMAGYTSHQSHLQSGVV